MSGKVDIDDRFDASGSPAERLLMLQYDFLKHLTSLSLLAIGGTVTFAGSIFAEVSDKQTLWSATGGFAIAAILAFTGQMSLLRSLDVSSIATANWKRWILGQWGLKPAHSIAVAAFVLSLSVGALIAFAFENLE